MSEIILVEDDKNLGISLKNYFMNEGYQVQHCQNLGEAEEKITEKTDIVVLDWMLPDGQGIDLLKKMRQKGQNHPVIMLTARTELIDKVLGLESGADDYMTKPFEPRELMARIRAQLRNHSLKPLIADKENIIQRGDLFINGDTREVQYKNSVIDLTKMEYDLLKLLAETPNRVFSREEILNKVWGYDSFPSTRTVDTHILQLRQKLSEELIETIRSIGYRFRYSH